ncbi:MAG: Gfo/Idh/MocA family oxidoreductase [Calditrichaeota bacterium]|nr:Gfo/Idh/MocA family oxidoreductase [Calditrichota bacterium]
MTKYIKRREFIKMGALASVGIPMGFSTGQVLKNTSTKTIRMGVIGTGDRGAWEIYIMKATPGIDVVACCDIIPMHLQNGLNEAAEGARGYTDYKELLSQKDIDAVLICTPQHLHYQMALDAIAAKKHIICQKTMTLNTEEAIALSKAVKKTDRVFQVAYQWQNHPLFKKIQEMVRGGELGKVTHVRCNYNRNTDWRTKVDDPAMERLLNWRMYREYSGGLMAELCSHHINITNWFLDSVPEKVIGFGGIDYWKDGRETYDNVNTIFEYPGGVKATFQAITTNAYEDVSVIIMGTEGTIVLKNQEGQVAHFYSEKPKVEEVLSEDELKDVDAVSSATLKAWARGEAIPIEVENNTKDDLETTRAMFLDFIDCIHNKKIPRSNIENGRNVAIAVDMAIKAMRNGTIEYWKPEYNG